MFLGIIFQSSAKTISFFCDFEIENIIFDTEEEETKEKELTENEDNTFEMILFDISFKETQSKTTKISFMKIPNRIDFSLDIKIPPPEYVYCLSTNQNSCS